MYPMMANSAEAISGIARFSILSDTVATPNVVRNAKAYGGTVRSCAIAALNPRSLIIVGCGQLGQPLSAVFIKLPSIQVLDQRKTYQKQ